MQFKNYKVADVAREAVFIADCREWEGSAPPISDVILSDISN